MGRCRLAIARLPGYFNVANALAAFAAALALGVDAEPASAALAGAARVPGRFEPVQEGQRFAVLIDYAHTPDSLENVLRAARALSEARVILSSVPAGIATAASVQRWAGPQPRTQT